MPIFLPWASRRAISCSSASLGRSTGCGKCTENGRSSFTVAWLMSAGRITTATPRRLSAAWQARASTRRACSGLCTCSQNTEQLA